VFSKDVIQHPVTFLLYKVPFFDRSVVAIRNPILEFFVVYMLSFQDYTTSLDLIFAFGALWWHGNKIFDIFHMVILNSSGIARAYH